MKSTPIRIAWMIQSHDMKPPIIVMPMVWLNA